MRGLPSESDHGPAVALPGRGRDLPASPAVAGEERPRWRLRRSQRLDRTSVQRVLDTGDSVRSRLFRIQFSANGTAAARIALIVSKRNVPRAVDRSRIRRLIRESFRLHQDRWQGVDCVVRLTQPHASEAPYAVELGKLLRRRGR